MMRPDREMTPQEIGTRDRRIARAVKSGVPVRQVAHQNKIDHRLVVQICKGMGVEPPQPGRRNWL